MPRFIDSIQRGLGQGLLPADSPTFAGLTLTGLTASLPVVTNSGKALASLAYTGATSFRKNLGLETDDSPTFNQGNFTILHTTTILADHIGEHGSGHTVVFDNTVALPAATIVPDAGTIGLGSGKGLIQFDDETVDFISFLNCDIGIGVTGSVSPTAKLNIRDGNIVFTSAGVTHGMTANAPTNAWLQFNPRSSTEGGCDIYALTDDGSTIPMLFNGVFGATDPDDATPAVVFRGGKWNGSTSWGALGAAETAVQFRNYTTILVTVLGNGATGFGGDANPAEMVDVTGNINATGVLKIDDVQVVSNRVIDARCDDTINSGDATTDGVIDALRDAMITHGLIAASA